MSRRPLRAVLLGLLASASVALAIDFGTVAGQVFTGGTVASQSFTLGGWTPANATGLVAWWDLTSTTYVSTSGSNVTGVTDRSGNGHDLNVISATAPTFNATRFGASLGGVDFVAASSTFLARNSAPVTAAPFQVYVIARSNNVTTLYFPFFLGDKDVATDYWGAGFAGATANDPVAWQVADTSTSTAITSTGYTAGTTRLIWCLETSSVSRAVRLDGAGEGTNTTDLSPDNADRVGLGALLDSTPTNYLDGSIAEVVLLNTSSTADRANFHDYFERRGYGLTLP